MLEILDRLGNVIAVINQKRGSAFLIDEERAKFGRAVPQPMPMSWKRYLLMMVFFPLLLPIDLWLRKRLK